MKTLTESLGERASSLLVNEHSGPTYRLSSERDSARREPRPPGVVRRLHGSSTAADWTGWDEVTDLRGVAVTWVELAGAAGKGIEVGSHLFEVCDALRDLYGPTLDKSQDVRARHVASFTKADDLADLAQAEADGLCSPAETEARQRVVGIVAVAAR